MLEEFPPGPVSTESLVIDGQVWFEFLRTEIMNSSSTFPTYYRKRWSVADPIGYGDAAGGTPLAQHAATSLGIREVWLRETSLLETAGHM